MTDGRMLIVDDELDMLAGLERTLERSMPELTVVTANNGSDALALVKEKSFDLALLDISMPDMNGLELLEKMKAADPQLSVVMMTAYGSIELAVKAIKKGAYDFITKPFNKEILQRTIHKGLERNRLLRENQNLRQMVCEHDALARFIGQSKTIRKLQDKLETIAQSNYTVLVRGESGTGKELAAHAIHDLSNRRNKKLIIVNCPAVPEHLLESELFGHQKGAFTGADQKQVGLFMEADGGTICLDEIGDIPVAVQTKLLRVLQEQEIKPLGSVKTRKIDVRILAVTNQDLEEKIARNEFREDLFHRLNIVNIRLPSLKDLKQDIPLLVNHFAKKICCELSIDERHFSAGAIKQFQERPWPGNVRELQNTLRQIIMFSTETLITEDDLDFPEAIEKQHNHNSIDLFTEDDLQPYKTAKDQLIQQFTDQYISSLLEKSAGNVTRAAQISGLTRPALHKIIRRLKNEKSIGR